MRIAPDRTGAIGVRGRPMRGLALSDDAVGTLHEGRQAYVGVLAGAGPHVTPELYAWSSGRLWFASATTTLKTRVLRRRGRGAALVSAGGRDVLLRGPVRAYDLRHPIELGQAAADLPAAALAWLGYSVRNSPDLLAFAVDTAAGRLGSRVPPLRVLHALRRRRVRGQEVLRARVERRAAGLHRGVALHRG